MRAYPTSPPSPPPSAALAWRWPLLAAGVWCVVGLLATAADYSDQVRAGNTASIGASLRLYTIVFAPFAGLSAALALLFDRAADTWLRARRLLALYGGIVCVFLPVYAVYEGAALLALEGKPVPGPLTLLLEGGAWGRWLDFLMATLALAVQASLAHWERGTRHTLAQAAARRANLDLRLALLQGQLEPAFLLSSMEGIGLLVRDAERPLATRALARLSELLRHALRASQQRWLGVADELTFARAFLQLQALRFGDRLNLSWDIEERDWDAVAIPPLLMHALLGHAIERGLEVPGSRCELAIELALRDGRVVLALVFDGYPPGSSTPPDLAATRERLSLMYEGQATLDYQPRPNGARVAVSLPAWERDDA